MDSLRTDFRLALRILLKKPGYSAVAVIALAIGIGANTAVFSMVDALVLRPLAFEDLDRLSQSLLAFVQVSDLAGVPRELATDADRIFPGEGDFRLGPILDKLRGLRYEGWVSLELFNPTLWEAKPSQVAELGLTAMQRLFGQVGT